MSRKKTKEELILEATKLKHEKLLKSKEQVHSEVHSSVDGREQSTESVKSINRHGVVSHNGRVIMVQSSLQNYLPTYENLPPNDLQAVYSQPSHPDSKLKRPLHSRQGSFDMPPSDNESRGSIT